MQLAFLLIATSSHIAATLAFLLSPRQPPSHDVCHQTDRQPSGATALQLGETDVSSVANSIRVSTIDANDDIIALADLRYREWMAGDPNAPKLSSFRLATAEIYEERRQEGSTVFLARISNGGGNDVAVGAAELSPIEMRGALTGDEDTLRPLYVTDVVAASSHRRLGIGSKLMDAVEKEARETGSRVLFLHVKHDNVGARRFYERRGYVDTMGEDFIGGRISIRLQSSRSNDDTHDVMTIDANILAENAGTVGQLLMMKELSPPLIDDAPIQSTNSALVGGGFGKRVATTRKKRKERKR
ncbi:hypothetical protein ACHAXT_005941 [Thalassiosira profunda]